MKPKIMQTTDTRKLARAGILCALIIVMTVVPYTGYIYYGLIEITTLHIVVAVGAVLLGWEYGAVLGLVEQSGKRGQRLGVRVLVGHGLAAMQ